MGQPSRVGAGVAHRAPDVGCPHRRPEDCDALGHGAARRLVRQARIPPDRAGVRPRRTRHAPGRHRDLRMRAEPVRSWPRTRGLRRCCRRCPLRTAVTTSSSRRSRGSRRTTPPYGSILDRLRADLPTTSLVGGAAAENVDLENLLHDSAPLVIGVVLFTRASSCCCSRCARH